LTAMSQSSSLLELFLTFLKIGAVMFGGGYAMIPILRYEVVVRHGWLSEQEFLDIVAIAESTPGPVAVNAATYIGYKVGGVPGSILATTAVVLPAFLVILGIAVALRVYYEHPVVRGMLRGIRAAVLGLVASALVLLVRGVFAGLGVHASAATAIIAALVFIAVTVFDLDPIVMIGASALIGLVLHMIGVL